MSGTVTFTEWLRERDDSELRALIVARPELMSPVPATLAALAARATAFASISRALDQLDRRHLAVLEAVSVGRPPVAAQSLTRALGATSATERAAVAGALARLRTAALVWGPDDDLKAAPGVAQAQAVSTPAGLGPPAVELFGAYPHDRLMALLRDMDVEGVDELAERLANPGDLIEAAGDQARGALDLLAWGPPVGRVADARRAVSVATAASPVEALLARGLLAATDEASVTLPREVGLYLRDGALYRDLTFAPPPVEGPVRTGKLVEATAGGQAFGAVRAIEQLLDRWGVDPPAVLRSGGIGIRDVRATATALDIPEWTTALFIEIAYVAGLLGSDANGGRWLPTRAYDSWLATDIPQRWEALATAWLTTDRVAGLAGSRDDRDRLVNVLTNDLVRVSAPHTRRLIVEALATALGSGARSGAGVEAGTAPTADSIRAELGWREPRRAGTLRDQMVDWTLREAETLGVTGLGAPAAHVRTLLDGTPPTTLAAALPTPVDHVLIQADLTAVAPGPLVSDLARELALAADVESTGGATVYRFTPDSIRRALDAGRGSAELIELLRRHSPTRLPQPLTYLIEDMARRHGHLRVGMASSYVRCDDPALLDEVTADRRAESLRLSRLAPTVAASRLTRAELVDALRALGYAPVAESIEGSTLITRRDARRTDATVPPRTPMVSRPVDPAVAHAAVRALRAGDKAASRNEDGLPRSPVSATVDMLREAADRGARMWIGYLDEQGRASSRIVAPSRVEGGYLTAFDATRDSIHRFALHRITGVSDVADA
jgi:hypothetical protein